MNKEEIIKKSHPLLVSSIRKYARSKGEFNDLYQEGIVHLLEILPSYDENSHLTIFNYLKTNLRFFYLNYGRYSKPCSSLNFIDEDGNELIWLLEDQSCSIIDNLIKNQEQQNLKEAIKGLRADDKWLLVEIFYHEKTLTEIANEQGTTISTVFRKKEKLLKRMKSFYEKNEIE